MFALLSNAESVGAGMKTAESIREWGNMRFKKESEDYYRTVNLTQTHDDALFRKIEMTHAYVSSFDEKVELHKRVHSIKLGLLQREDLLVFKMLDEEGDGHEHYF